MPGTAPRMPRNAQVPKVIGFETGKSACVRNYRLSVLLDRLMKKTQKIAWNELDQDFIQKLYDTQPKDETHQLIYHRFILKLKNKLQHHQRANTQLIITARGKKTKY